MIANLEVISLKRFIIYVNLYEKFMIMLDVRNVTVKYSEFGLAASDL